jgi:hypothetical protein
MDGWICVLANHTAPLHHQHITPHSTASQITRVCAGPKQQWPRGRTCTRWGCFMNFLAVQRHRQQAPARRTVFRCDPAASALCCTRCVRLACNRCLAWTRVPAR